MAVKIWLVVLTLGLAAAGALVYVQHAELEEVRAEVESARDEAQRGREELAEAVGQLIAERVGAVESDIDELERSLVGLPDLAYRVDELDGLVADLEDCTNNAIDALTRGQFVYYC